MGGKNTNTNKASWWKVVIQRWQILLAIPLVNLLLTVIFWQSQIFHYQHSTRGILFMWLVAGLIFILIQLSLQADALRIVLRELPKDRDRLEIIWSLVAQLVIFVVIAVYNGVVLVELLALGAIPDKPLDFVIVAILAATLVFIAARYRHQVQDPRARLLLATGMKAAPQWLQAVNFIIFGSFGMSFITIITITGMGTLRYISARHTASKFQKPETLAARAAAFRDVISIFAMLVAWCAGRL